MASNKRMKVTIKPLFVSLKQFNKRNYFECVSQCNIELKALYYTKKRCNKS